MQHAAKMAAGYLQAAPAVTDVRLRPLEPRPLRLNIFVTIAMRATKLNDARSKPSSSLPAAVMETPATTK